MSASRGLWGIVGLVSLVALCCLAIPGRVLSDTGDVTLRGFVGGAYLPMGEWQDSIGATGHYHADALGRTGEIAVAYELSSRVSLLLSGGMVTKSATRSDYLFFLGLWGEVVDSTAWYSRWDFTGYPVGLSVEVYPWGSKGPVSVCFGPGCSCYFSEVHEQAHLMPAKYDLEGGSGTPRRGVGFGVHAYVSVRAEVGHGFAVISRLRAQYADGMAFTERDRSGPIPFRDLGLPEPHPAVSFSGLDLSIGLGWSPSACRRHK
jgi:hypothetical protein